MNGPRLTVHLVVDVEQVGPVAAAPSSVAGAIAQAVRGKHLVWVDNADSAKTAYRLWRVRPASTDDVIELAARTGGSVR
jgi:hypothetical protein